jgi:hypothetical protein
VDAIAEIASYAEFVVLENALANSDFTDPMKKPPQFVGGIPMT